MGYDVKAGSNNIFCKPTQAPHCESESRGLHAFYVVTFCSCLIYESIENKQVDQESARQPGIIVMCNVGSYSKGWIQDENPKEPQFCPY